MLDGLMRRVATHCCGQARIDHADWAFVEMGQSYLKQGIGAIAEAAERKKRVLVVGLYVSSSALRVHQRVMARQRSPWVANFLERSEVVFSEQGIISSPSAVRWVLDAAGGAIDPISEGSSAK